MLDNIKDIGIQAGIGYGVGTLLEINPVHGALFLAITTLVSKVASKIFDRYTNIGQAAQQFVSLAGIAVVTYALPVSVIQALALVGSAMLGARAQNAMRNTYRHVTDRQFTI